MATYKKIPYGISNIERLIKDNYYYVDKSGYIEVLENLNEPYICFFRPRRFGKSLFVSLLCNYYDKAKANEFDHIFKELYIGKNPTPLKSSYCVLQFNFSGINIHDKDNIQRLFDYSVLKSLRSFIYDYLPDFTIDPSLDASSMLNLLLGEAKKLNSKIYVIIDEYDHFTSELLGYNKALFDEVVSKSGFFRKFFEVLKIGTETVIDRIFFTGVNPITLDSLTSGFNISSNLTLHPKLHEMMGFNEAEIKTLFNHYNISSEDFNMLLPVLKQHYDGYIFVDEPTNHLYNSDMVLYFTKDYLEERKPPKNLIDENIASSYTKIKRFVEMGDYEQNIAFIRDLLEGNEVSMVLTTKFEPTSRFNIDDFKSLFFNLGLITLDGSGLRGFKVRIPNYVIKELYFTFFEHILENQSNYRVDISGVTNAIADIAEFGRIDTLIKITEGRLQKLSKRDFIRFDEKYVKLVMLNYLFMSQIYFVKSEYEVEGGYIDIALLPRVNVKAPNHAIIEPKYIPKESFTDKLMQEKIAEAEAQLSRYSTSDELRQVPNLLKFVVVFKGDECMYAGRISPENLY